MPNITRPQRRVLHFLANKKAIEIGHIARALHLSEKDVAADIRVLQEQNFVAGPPSLLSRCQKLLADMGETDLCAPDYPAGIVLIASVITRRADEEYLSDELGYDFEFVGAVGARLRNAKLWHDDEVPEAVCERWLGEEGGTAFFLDFNVASGAMECLEGDTTDPSYRMTPDGNRRVERMMRKE